MRPLSLSELVRWRSASSLLAIRAADPVAAVSRLLGLQGQDIPAVRLSVRARADSGVDADVVAALDTPATLVRTWVMRGTLHLVAARDVRWLTGLFGPCLRAATVRRRGELGIPDERCEAALPLLQDILARGPLVRADIVTGLNDRGFPIAKGSQAVPHLLAYAASVGLLCCGPGEAFALADDWLPPAPEPPDPIAELARRYLAGHAPAAPADLAAWSGLPLSRARAAFSAIEGELQWWETELGPMAALAERLPNKGNSPIARLLPRYDGYLLGWRDRDLVVDPAHRRAIHPGGGVINAALTIDGVVRGTWRYERGAHHRIRVTPFAALKRTEITAVESDVRDVGRFVGHDVELVSGQVPTAAKGRQGAGRDERR
jgi:hypothetical protein